MHTIRSKFEAEGVTEKLNQKSADLRKAYMEAYKDKDRNKECKMWDNIMVKIGDSSIKRGD